MTLVSRLFGFAMALGLTGRVVPVDARRHHQDIETSRATRASS